MNEEENIEDSSSCKSEPILNLTIQKKTKMFFFSQREAILYSNGSFMYKKKNDSKNKIIQPSQITQITRSKQILHVSYEGKELTFKFPHQALAKEWHISMKPFVN